MFFGVINSSSRIFNVVSSDKKLPGFNAFPVSQDSKVFSRLFDSGKDHRSSPQSPPGAYVLYRRKIRFLLTVVCVAYLFVYFA